jgi:hypothetical protein
LQNGKKEVTIPKRRERGICMKNYMPIILGVVVIAAAGIFARQYTMRQSIELGTQKNSALVISPGEEQPGTASGTPQVGSATSAAVSGIALTVSTPANNANVSVSSLPVKGKTVPGAEVFVNDVETIADAGGYFSVTLNLEEGDNYILIVANDVSGNYAEKELRVNYTP